MPLEIPRTSCGFSADSRLQGLRPNPRQRRRTRSDNAALHTRNTSAPIRGSRNHRRRRIPPASRHPATRKTDAAGTAAHDEIRAPRRCCRISIWKPLVPEVRTPLTGVAERTGMSATSPFSSDGTSDHDFVSADPLSVIVTVVCERIEQRRQIVDRRLAQCTPAQLVRPIGRRQICNRVSPSHATCNEFTNSATPLSSICVASRINSMPISRPSARDPRSPR